MLITVMVQVQEADQCTAVWSEPDPQQAFHAVVVPHHQPCQCVRGLPSAAGSDWHLHAWQDPHPQDLPHPDLQGALVAEGARERGHGLVSPPWLFMPPEASLTSQSCAETCKCAIKDTSASLAQSSPSRKHVFLIFCGPDAQGESLYDSQ